MAVGAALEAAPGCVHPHKVPHSSSVVKSRLPALSRAFDELAEREQFVMRMVYEHGLRFDEAGFTIGVSGSHAERIHDGAVAGLLSACTQRPSQPLRPPLRPAG